MCTKFHKDNYSVTVVTEKQQLFQNRYYGSSYLRNALLVPNNVEH